MDGTATFENEMDVGLSAFTSSLHTGPHVLCVGGEDHYLRIPFMVALRRQGFRVSAVGSGGLEPFARAGIAYDRFTLSRFVAPLADRKTVRELRGCIVARRPDIVQSFDTKPNLLAPLAVTGLAGVHAVRTINGMGWVYSARTPVARALRPVQRVLHRRAARHVAATVFQNQDDFGFFRAHRLVGRGSARLIRGSGIDASQFETRLATAEPEQDLRARLELGAAPVVITVTRLTRQKGVETLLAAAARVHRARPEVQFLLVGGRETEGRLAIGADEIERHRPYVRAIGVRDDVPALLRLADVFAFPTEYREGVPRVLLEAALAGVPVVTTNMPGCNDVITNGISGLVVPTRAPEALASAILDLLADRPWARGLADQARAHVRQGFEMNLVVDGYVSLYRQLLQRSGF